MKLQRDYVRIAGDLKTFTSDEFADAIGTPVNNANNILLALIRRRVMTRQRVGKKFLYALSGNGKRQCEALPAIDPDSRAPTPLEMAQECQCRHHDINALHFNPHVAVYHSEYYADDVSQRQWQCTKCYGFVAFTYDNVPF